MTTSFEEKEAAEREWQHKADTHEAEQYPLADRLAREFHAEQRAYYTWENMQPEYRRSTRQVMQYAVEHFKGQRP